MNSNKRVIVNAMATYGRTLLRMGLGLFSSRWVLEALGEVDYGLMGVVGTLIVFITFLNSVFSGACSRFFAYSIGKQDNDDLVRWFNVGFFAHLSLAVILTCLLGPIGEWAINNVLNIPPDRVDTAKWVFRLSLLSAFWTIFSTPFTAMYVATQNIAEFTIWEIVNIVINFGFVYWLTTYVGNAWLIYAGFTVVLTIFLGLGQVIRALNIFPGCHLKINYWFDWHRLKQMVSFSGWSFFGSLGYLARAQFPPILLNYFFNPLRYAYVNASYQIGGALAGYTQSMSSALLGAFTPQITTLAGADRRSEMIVTSFRASKFGTLLTLMFAIPLSLEADYLLVLWLKKPPLLAADFCRIVMIQMILDNLTFGHVAGIMASGNIKWYQLVTGALCVLSIPIGWLILDIGFSPLSVSWVIAGCVMACSMARLVFGKLILGIGCVKWFKCIFMPILIISFIALTIGIGSMQMIAPSFMRICITSMLTCFSMVISSWFLLFDQDEKKGVLNLINKIKLKFVGIYKISL